MLGAGPIEVAVLRALELVAALVVRPRRRRVGGSPATPAGHDLAPTSGGRCSSAPFPSPPSLGILAIWQLFVVAVLAAVLTTFFDLGRHAYLPTLVDKRQLVAANRALAASASAAEFTAFGISGFLVQLLTRAGRDRGRRRLVRGLGRPARHDPPARTAARHRPRTASRSCDEIREGLRLVARDPVLRAFAGARCRRRVLWGVFGPTYLLFATRELGLGPAAIGVIAGVGGAGSLVGALVAERTARRLGLGRTLLLAMLGFAVGNAFIPLAPAGAVVLGAACLIAQQLVADSAGTIYDVTRGLGPADARRGPSLGRVNGTFRFFAVLVQLAATLAAGLLAESLGSGRDGRRRARRGRRRSPSSGSRRSAR